MSRFLTVALSIVMLAATACDPGSWPYSGRVTTIEGGRICVRTNHPKRYDDQPWPVLPEGCGHSRRTTDASTLKAGDCVEGNYVNFPEANEAPPMQEAAE